MQGWLGFLLQLLFCPVLWLFDWAGIPVYTELMMWTLTMAYISACAATVVAVLSFLATQDAGACICICDAGLAPSPAPAPAPVPATWPQVILLVTALVAAWVIPTAASLVVFFKEDVPQRGKDVAELRAHITALQRQLGDEEQAGAGGALRRWSHLLGAILTRLKRTELEAWGRA